LLIAFCTLVVVGLIVRLLWAAEINIFKILKTFLTESFRLTGYILHGYIFPFAWVVCCWQRIEPKDFTDWHSGGACLGVLSIVGLFLFSSWQLAAFGWGLLW
jgi:hypothetical protein